MDGQALADLARAGAARHLPRMLRLLRSLCAVDCGTGNEAGIYQVIDLLRPLLDELGARTQLVPAPGLGAHVAARLTPEGNVSQGKLLLCAHLDTVFGPGLAQRHPFHIEGEWACGLGAGDCKSGVLIALFGALILKEAGLLPLWELVFLFSCDEETGSQSGRLLYQREAPGARCALVFEGARERQGRPCFVTARRGVLVGSIQVQGREAHAGKDYLEGRSAVLELAHQIIRLYSFNDLDRGIYFNAAPISGGRPNGVVAGQAQAEFCVAGLASSADFARAEEQLSSLERQITVEGCTVQVRRRTLFPALERTPASAALYGRAADAARLLGWEAMEIDDPSATDAAWLSAAGVPALDALSALAEDIHTTYERLNLPSLQARTALCALLLASFRS